VVMGSCGVGFAPVQPDKHDWLIGLMEGVEDIPGAALTEGIEWHWESFGEYLDHLSTRRTSIDFAAQVPHGAVRGYVMGERGANNEVATPDDIKLMSSIVEDGIAAGALGFSTSRTLLHRAIDGRLVPGTHADELELFALANAVKRGGGRIFQVACEHGDVPSEIDWMSRMSKEIGLDVMFNLSQVDQAPNLWRAVMQKLEAANASGARLKAQVAGRAIGILMSFAGTAHPFALKPSWLALGDASWATKRSHLSNPEFRKRLLEEKAVHVGEFESFVTTSFHKMFSVESGYEPKPSQSLSALSQATGRSAQELAMDLLTQNDYEGMIYFPLFNYSDGHLDPLRELHQSPHTLLGLSDAGAHCGAICDGGMPTFMLSHWGRDRNEGLPLEWMVHRQTQQTAAAFGFFDRGVIEVGKRADINVIDMNQLKLNLPKMAWDLPAGGRRLVQRASGYALTLCNGIPILENDEILDARPGRLVRRQS
ncbi:MAG: N-acyl-D-amino-acid deacylase family protein, partial [Bradymonadia bacterium]